MYIAHPWCCYSIFIWCTYSCMHALLYAWCKSTLPNDHNDDLLNWDSISFCSDPLSAVFGFVCTSVVVIFFQWWTLNRRIDAYCFILFLFLLTFERSRLHLSLVPIIKLFVDFILSSAVESYHYHTYHYLEINLK